MIVESIRPPSPGKEGLAMSAQHKSSRIDEWLLQRIYRAAGQPAVRLVLRNSAEVSPKDALPVANIVIQDRKTLLRLLLDPEAEFGDANSARNWTTYAARCNCNRGSGSWTQAADGAHWPFTWQKTME